MLSLDTVDVSKRHMPEMTMGHTFWPVTHVTHQPIIDRWPAWPPTRDSRLLTSHDSRLLQFPVRITKWKCSQNQTSSMPVLGILLTWSWGNGSWVLTRDPRDPLRFVDPLDLWPADPLSSLTHAFLLCIEDVKSESRLTNWNNTTRATKAIAPRTDDAIITVV